MITKPIAEMTDQELDQHLKDEHQRILSKIQVQRNLSIPKGIRNIRFKRSP